MQQYDSWISQEDALDAWLKEGADAFTTVWRQQDDDSGHLGLYCALSAVDRRATALSRPEWDVHITDGRPGFVQSGTATEYFRFPEEGLEPLVLVRNFHGVKESYTELSEEFRLYHNLHQPSGSRSLVSVLDHGAVEAAVNVEQDGTIRVRSRLLRQYQAARQMDLLLFIDSVRNADSEEALPPEQEWSEEEMRAIRHPFDGAFGGGGTRLLGTRVLPAPPVDASAIWPFDVADDNYPEFIIGHDELGNEVRYSCRPDRLANYFGANPQSPHYLTPVHFDRAVLKKYYDNPELYSVEDGFLRCAGLWGLRLDNDLEDRVVVFLGDLGRDLPSPERDYWRSFNIPPDTDMSETGVRRAFGGQFADPQSPDLRLRVSYGAFLAEWRSTVGWDLFRPMAGADTALPQQIRVPVDDSQPEFDACLLILSKVFVDSLADTELKTRIPPGEDGERSVSRLGRWLEQEDYPHTERDVTLLRSVQSLRSAGSAHRKGSSYPKALERAVGEARGQAAGQLLIDGLARMLADLLEWAQARWGQD